MVEGTDGEASADTLLDEAATLASDGVRALGVASVEAELVAFPRPGERYELQKVLGEGGMGEVTLCHDRVIGRDVAQKVVKAGVATRAEAHTRFLREARVQGQLEHPAIVPVYDLGRDDDGRLWFTMKRVRGETLETILDLQRRGVREAIERHTRHKLLSAFTRVCLAIDFAHERGVVHRDLKPANVMLGEYGEVYVLDWGLAKLSEQDKKSKDEHPSESNAGATVAGAILGTPGYMAPEQTEADRKVDARADIYALGAILFELLTLEELHPRTSLREIFSRTRDGTSDARPSIRAPQREIPPELDAICVRATEVDPARRFGSAREIADAIEKLLNGDRDVELRRTLAAEHLARARDAATISTTSARSDALRELGRALALAPDDVEARTLLMRMLVEPPAAPPAEVMTALEESEIATRGAMLRRAAALLAAPVVFVAPFVLVFGVRDLRLVALVPILFIASASSALLSSRSRAQPGLVTSLRTLITALAIAASSVLYGPFVFSPALATLMLSAMLLTRPKNVHLLTITIITGVGVALPAIAALAGVHPVKHLFANTTMTLEAGAIAFPPATIAFLVFVNLFVVGAAAFNAARHSNARAAADLKNALHAWQLRQLVPTETAPDHR